MADARLPVMLQPSKEGEREIPKAQPCIAYPTQSLIQDPEAHSSTKIETSKLIQFVHCVCRLWFNASCCFTSGFFRLLVAAPCACFLCSVSFQQRVWVLIWGMHTRPRCRTGLAAAGQGIMQVGCAVWGAGEWLGVVQRVLLARWPLGASSGVWFGVH